MVHHLQIVRVRSIAHPKHNQRVIYNGHKWVHGIKFQCVETPDRLIAYLSGLFEGKRHSSTMLHQSGLLNDLRCGFSQWAATLLMW